MAIDDYDVIIKVQNNEGFGERRFVLTEYTQKISQNIKRTLGDIELAFITAHKEPNYDVKSDTQFLAIRKALLNSANAVDRLPASIRCNGEYIYEPEPISEFIARKINSANK